MSKRYQAAILTASYNGLLVPNAPTIGTATAGSGSASVTFTAPSNVGGGAITSYTVISSPGSILGTGSSSPITVSGLTNDTAYTFTVVATNAYGSGPASAASNSVTPTVNYIESVFSTYLYTGNGSTQTITNGIDLSGKGGLVWAKQRSNTGTLMSHYLMDTARGTSAGYLSSNSTDGNTAYDIISAFNANGFNWKPPVNDTGYTYASWSFREQAKFFDVVTWTGTGGSGTRAISHNLGSTPGAIFIKKTNATNNWAVYHRSSDMLVLNSTAAAGAIWSGDVTAVSDTTFTIYANTGLNASGDTYVAYLFAHNAGGFGVNGTDNVITCGSYTGNGSASGPTVTLGYEPQFVMIKAAVDVRTSPESYNNWAMIDVMRGMPNPSTGTGYALGANLTTAENGGFLAANSTVVPTSTGFQIGANESMYNFSGCTYIYIAIRRGPMKVPTVGTSVFSPNTTSDDGDAITTGFPVDMFIEGLRAGNAINQALMDRLRGNGFVLTTSSTAAQSTVGEGGFASNTTIKPGLFGGGSPAIVWNFRRAPSFFDEVCYTGTGSARTITHNLGAVPELMIMKRRDTTANWPVYTASTATNEYLFLNSGGLPTTATTVWNNTAPTASVFSVGTSALTNASAGTYVAYLFSSCAGVSKVGSYTGTGALQTINCGFTSGARFVLIKLISSGTSGSGDWYVWDSARGITSGNDPYLLINSTSAEQTGTNFVDTDTTGFKVTAAGATDINASGDVYLFLAIA